MMNNKLQHFNTRNLRRNKHLYATGMTVGQDYVICPVSNARLSMIKSSYIIGVLGMSVAEYDTLHPAVQKNCTARSKNIQLGQQAIDANSGLSKYELGQEKARAVLNTTDSSGLSGYDRKGIKTRATHMANVDSMGRNGYRRQADARLTTILLNGLTVEQNAHEKQRQTMITNCVGGTGGASKISKKTLNPILEYLEESDIPYHFDKFEYGIKDTDTGKYYFYDLTITQMNMAIEYQSSAWHSNPSWNSDKWNNWCPPRGQKKTAQESLTYDYEKAAALYKHRGIRTYYVWEDSAKEDIDRILCSLKTHNMKY